MGACTSRHEVLKNAGEAPLPAPANEEVEVIKDEVITDNQEESPAAAAVDGDEAKRQSLGNLFKEGGEEKGSPENTSEQVKQEEVKPQEEESTDVVGTEKEAAIVTEASMEDTNKTVLAEASDEKKPADDEATKPEMTSSEKAEEEKSETETNEEVKTTEEQKTTGSDEKKPLFKLWF